jgi:hypothetical protein
MRTLSVLALFAAGLFAVPAVADDKEKELTGAFKRKAGELDMKLVFKKDNMMQFVINSGDNGCVLTAKYTRDKDGTVKCEVTDYEKKGEFPVKEKGYKFSFKWEAKDGKGKMSELKGDEIPEDAKQAIEGDYESASD